jgi:nucleoside-diphosphate-sugar epimerase
MSSMTFCVTGANGFIAAHLIKALKAKGHSVRGTVRDTAKSGEHVTSLGAEVFEVKDMSDATALGAAFAGVDGVFHMAAVHPEYGFAETKEGRDGILKCAVEGTQSVLTAAAKASVPRVVLTSSLAAVECGNDEGVLSEETWSRADVYDAVEKLEQTQWATHYSYVKSKVEQEKAALACAKELGLDMRVVVPGNLCIGPVEADHINGTMTRIRDIMSGTNSLKGAADLAIVHVQDVVETHVRCMADASANGRYIVAPDMVTIEDVFTALKELYPTMPVAEMNNMDIASGVPGKARKIDSRTEKELGLQLKTYKVALKDAVDSMVGQKMIAAIA